MQWMRDRDLSIEETLAFAQRISSEADYHRVARYLAQHQPELLIEFQKIAEMTSTLPSEAA